MTMNCSFSSKLMLIRIALFLGITNSMSVDIDVIRRDLRIGPTYIVHIDPEDTVFRVKEKIFIEQKRTRRREPRRCPTEMRLMDAKIGIDWPNEHFMQMYWTRLQTNNHIQLLYSDSSPPIHRAPRSRTNFYEMMKSKDIAQKPLLSTISSSSESMAKSVHSDSTLSDRTTPCILGAPHQSVRAITEHTNNHDLDTSSDSSATSSDPIDSFQTATISIVDEKGKCWRISVNLYDYIHRLKLRIQRSMNDQIRFRDIVLKHNGAVLCNDKRLSEYFKDLKSVSGITLESELAMSDSSEAESDDDQTEQSDTSSARSTPDLTEPPMPPPASHRTERAHSTSDEGNTQGTAQTASSIGISEIALCCGIVLLLVGLIMIIAFIVGANRFLADPKRLETGDFYRKEDARSTPQII